MKYKRIESGHYESYDEDGNLVAQIIRQQFLNTTWNIYGPRGSYVESFKHAQRVQDMVSGIRGRETRGPDGKLREARI